MQLAQHLGVLVRVHLHLELGRLFEVEVLLVVDVVAIDDFDGRLENFDELRRSLAELCVEVLIEGLQVPHLDLDEVVAAKGVVLQLVTVDEEVVLLRVAQEVHKLQLGLLQVYFRLVAEAAVLVDEVLVCDENLVSFKHVVINLN